MRIWNNILISDCQEPLIELPLSIKRFVPHPYQKLKAPYDKEQSPWRLRKSVIKKLIKSNNFLNSINNKINLCVFDAWRPISVQKFMIEYSINNECISNGINKNKSSDKNKINEIKKNVSKFWAFPSDDPSLPPPHSTGGAIDITFIDNQGNLLDMGGEIDELGILSEPNYYINSSEVKKRLFHKRRKLLSDVMTSFGFIQHPNEWWHFSFGDQLWAWKTDSGEAIYGRVPELSN